MFIGCRSVRYWPNVDRVFFGMRIGRVLIGCRSVEYRPSVDRVSVGRVSAECR